MRKNKEKNFQAIQLPDFHSMVNVENFWSYSVIQTFCGDGQSTDSFVFPVSIFYGSFTTAVIKRTLALSRVWMNFLQASFASR